MKHELSSSYVCFIEKPFDIEIKALLINTYPRSYNFAHTSAKATPSLSLSHQQFQAAESDYRCFNFDII